MRSSRFACCGGTSPVGDVPGKRTRSTVAVAVAVGVVRVGGGGCVSPTCSAVGLSRRPTVNTVCIRPRPTRIILHRLHIARIQRNLLGQRQRHDRNRIPTHHTLTPHPPQPLLTLNLLILLIQPHRRRRNQKTLPPHRHQPIPSPYRTNRNRRATPLPPITPPPMFTVQPRISNRHCCGHFTSRARARRGVHHTIQFIRLALTTTDDAQTATTCVCGGGGGGGCGGIARSERVLVDSGGDHVVVSKCRGLQDAC